MSNANEKVSYHDGSLDYCDILDEQELNQQELENVSGGRQVPLRRASSPPANPRPANPEANRPTPILDRSLSAPGRLQDPARAHEDTYRYMPRWMLAPELR